MIDPQSAQSLLAQVNEFHASGRALRHEAMELLSKLPNYNWCGIYRLEGEILVLDEFVGEETEHTRIPVGRGVCGTAVAENRNQVIADVTQLGNYLACSLTTKSEIVVLIREADSANVLGQIDIDGHTVQAFDESDEAMLERLAQLLADRWADSE